MDNGSHFYRCDFQVHTPRDPAWRGFRPVHEVDRKKYATTFIKECRTRGIHAVAITDHHDFGFLPYIRHAAETDPLIAEGNNQPVIIFPGIELTLGVPCQAILLLDADFPIQSLNDVCRILAITQDDPLNAQHAEIKQLVNIRDLSALHERLDEQEFLRGRYIVLPNVSPKGYQTLHRTGFLAHYRTMPCVGGYIDGGIERIERGDWRIFNGEIEAYANKAIGLFCTSDSRSYDLENLGKSSTWVKWSRPTAEALRQACLARHTRISHQEPERPSQVIKSLYVEDSKFLGTVDLIFNPQFNCVIGGRGTGKSTMLEYLRWALCDQPPDLSDDENLPDFQSKRKSLIEKTLGAKRVEVAFSVNGVEHVVLRNGATGAVQLRVGDSDFISTSEVEVRGLLRIDAYSQKQLSSIAVRTDELLRFLESPIRFQLAEISSRVESLKLTIRSSYAKVERGRHLANEIHKMQTELDSQQKQLESLRSQLRNLSDDDRNVIAQHDRLLIDQRLFSDWNRERNDLRSGIQQLQVAIQALPAQIGDLAIEDKVVLAQYFQEQDSLYLFARRRLLEIIQAIDAMESSEHPAASARAKWERNYKAHQIRYQEVLQRSESQKQLLDQIVVAESRIKEVQANLATKQAEAKSLVPEEKVYRDARQQWFDIYQSRSDLVEEQCQRVTSLSRGSLRATLKRGGGISRATDAIKPILDKTGIRGRDKKLPQLSDHLASATDPVEKWTQLLDEFEALAKTYFPTGDTAPAPYCPILLEAEFTEDDCRKIAKNLSEERWLELSLTELMDEPHFEYRHGQNEYIAFRDASAGQQATVLLRILLSQKGPPLIIDQPEDDLDNEVILEIVQEIWQAKKNRQIIVSSHNANIVVNGDADLVIVCAYCEGSEKSRGMIKVEGAIDMEEIRQQITKIIEGGKDAFQLRRHKYGF